MGDIAFNLLIFFVILARAQDDSHLQWTPAEATNIETAGHSVVSVLIDSDEKLYLNGQPIGESNLEMKIDKEKFPFEIVDFAVGDRTVLLKVHREATALRFEPVIEAISNAGGELVHVVEEDRDE